MMRLLKWILIKIQVKSNCFTALVVDEVEDDELQVALDELDDNSSELAVGDFYKVEKPVQNLGRAAVTAKTSKQKIRS